MTEEEILQHLQELLTPRRRQLFEQVLTNRTNFFTVATQDVYQLHNTSAVIRSCDVFGIQNIHVIEERMPKRIDKEIAMGAQKWVDVQRYSATKDCLHTLRKKGYRIIATSPHEDAVMLDDFDISTPAAFFFGTEREGLSQEILEEADSTLKIPMVGFTESLNISVSAAIILQSVTEKMRRSNLPWRLSAAEKFQIELAWTKKTIKNSDQIIERFHNS
ncbi:MAG: RNA methyltransferase [Christiangramia sp.]|nr:rRNA methyltransferase [Christiangramia sp.]|tara:strand:+ start:341 stop:994 length:654 start_codon:yes stop_codon:yes gene_type:complete